MKKEYILHETWDKKIKRMIQQHFIPKPLFW